MILKDPRQAHVFRFVRHEYSHHNSQGEARLIYAFDDGPELIECIRFPDAPDITSDRQAAFSATLELLHLIAGVSYYKAGVPNDICIENCTLDKATAYFFDSLYLHGLGEFAYHNKLNLRERIRFPGNETLEVCHLHASGNPVKTISFTDYFHAPSLDLPHRTLIPIGGGKDSLVSVEWLKATHQPATAIWVGHSPLIAACAERSGLPTLNIHRELSPLLFEYNRLGAYNGHIPVTAINSAILAVAAVLYGYDAIAFSNERSASSATIEYEGQAVNHQWSKSWAFEAGFHTLLKTHVAADLHYYSQLRPFSELAVAQRFAQTRTYDDVFSSCNRNFRILGPKPVDRWCGQCPKCHFVFLALAPFMPKPRLLAIFGRNLLDDAALTSAFDALMEYHQHKPFECVGEGRESRAAMYALAQRPDWREDTIVARFSDEILPQLDENNLAIEPLLVPSGEHNIPDHLKGIW